LEHKKGQPRHRGHGDEKAEAKLPESRSHRPKAHLAWRLNPEAEATAQQEHDSGRYQKPAENVEERMAVEPPFRPKMDDGIPQQSDPGAEKTCDGERDEKEDQDSLIALHGLRSLH